MMGAIVFGALCAIVFFAIGHEMGGEHKQRATEQFFRDKRNAWNPKVLSAVEFDSGIVYYSLHPSGKCGIMTPRYDIVMSTTESLYCFSVEREEWLNMETGKIVMQSRHEKLDALYKSYKNQLAVDAEVVRLAKMAKEKL